VHIGILGGTGPAGSGLAARLASAGLDVTIGSRSKDRANEKAFGLKGRWPEAKLSIAGGTNEAAAACDLVVLATPWDAAPDTAASVHSLLGGKVVISMANALVKVGDEFEPLIPPRGSVAAHVQATVPSAMVAAAFQHLPAKELGDIDSPMEGDVLICSDHAAAIEATADLVRKIPGLRPLCAGTLAAATPIEALTAVLLGLNIRYRTRAGVSFTGIPNDRV
jgi:8-hydroxy-5-deazaflavin:NADPH oxidoreductase